MKKKISIPSNKKGLIFDIDGTLVDTMPVHYKACQIVCNKYGFDFPLDYFYAKAGIPTLSVFEMLVKDLDLPYNGRQLGQEKEEKYLELIHEVKPLDIVYDIAKEFHTILPMSLGTGATKEIAIKTIKAAGVSHLFDIIITCEDISKPKPAPDTFLLCAEKMKVNPRDCHVFEDGNPGIQAALEAGMTVTDIRNYL